MKKLLALLMAVMVLTFACVACAKKDNTKTSEPTQTENSTSNENSTEGNAETAEPDQSYESENTEMSEFESLVDTFQNSTDEEEREAARIEIERILEQAEQQAQ